MTSSEDAAHYADFNNPHNVTAEQAKALALSGGTMTGAIKWNEGKAEIVGQSDGNFVIRNKKLTEDGNDDILAFQNTELLQNLLRVYRNGVPYSVYGQHNKPSASDVGAVAKTGGTMTGALTINKPSNWAQIIVNSPSGNYRSFEADDSRVRIDVRDDTHTTDRRFLDIFSNAGESDVAGAMKLCQVVDGVSVAYPIFHKGNKPSGSYDGSGSATERQIQVGGIGTTLLVSSKYGVVFVYAEGARAYTTSSTSVYEDTKAKFVNGVLTLANSYTALNASGVVYSYEVL